MNDKHDAELVREAQRGNGAAFGELASRYYGLVYSVAWSVLRSREDAEEVAQEVLLRVYLRLGQLRDAGQFAAWLRQAAHHLSLNHLDREQRRKFLAPTIPIDEEALRMAEESLADTLEKREQERLLESALAELPEEQRELIVLHYSEGWTLKAISERLGVDATTVGRRLTRAVEALQARVGVDAPAQAARLGSRRAARVAAMALLATVAALPEAARAGMLAAAELPAAPAVAASPKATGLVSLFSSLLPSSPSAAVTGALAMSKAKVITVAAAGLLLAGGTAYVLKPEDTARAAASPAMEQQAGPVPSFAQNDPRWLAGSWLGTAQLRTDRFRLVLDVKEGADGKAQARFYTPDFAVGSRRAESITVQPDGQFHVDVPLINGGLIARVVDPHTIEGTWREGDASSAMTMQRVANPPALPMPPARKEITLPAAALDQCVGTYAQSARDQMVVKRTSAGLMTKLDDSDPFVIYAEADGKFFSREADIQFDFVRDATGRVVQMIRTESFREPAGVRHYRRVE